MFALFLLSLLFVILNAKISAGFTAVLPLQENIVHNNAVLEYVMVDQAAENHDHYVIHDAGTEFLRGRLMIPGLSKSPHYVIQGLIRSDRSAIKT